MIKLSNELLVVEDGGHTQPLLEFQQSFCVLYCLLGPTLSIKWCEVTSDVVGALVQCVHSSNFKNKCHI